MKVTPTQEAESKRRSSAEKRKVREVSAEKSSKGEQFRAVLLDVIRKEVQKNAKNQV